VATSNEQARKAPDTSTLARHVVEALRGIGVRKIILFGSRVWGEPRPDSDLDVLVVLNEPGVPDTSAEKGALYRRVSTPLRDLQRKWPLDLIVHSLGMHRRFRERKSAFARKVLDEGEVVYENGS
jgi:predicted nucleotidyltransferase